MNELKKQRANALNTIPMKVFRFPVKFVNDTVLQYRYVVAPDEDSALEKLEKHIRQLLMDGFAEMRIVDYPIVELDYVID